MSDRRFPDSAPIDDVAVPDTTSHSVDPEQAAASRCRDQAILVMAGAGTGKTRTIIDRLGFVVGELGEDPSRIVVATFTNKAAHEIRERAAVTLGRDVASRMRMGTFHSIGAGILRRNAEAAGLSRGFRILPDDDATRLLRDAISEGGHLGPDEDVAEVAAEAGRRIKRWKSWGLTEADVEKPDRPARDPVEERYARMYVAYQHKMRVRGYVDFGDLCLIPMDLLFRDADVRVREASAVRYLLVDEAQDANSTQVLLAGRLTSVHRNVFAVGDVDQSIYSFQGGYPGAIAAIAGRGHTAFGLVRNRRCTDEILAPAVALVGRNRRASPKVLRSGRSGPPPELVRAASEREEGAKAVARIKQLAASGSPLSQIGVLARSSYALGSVEEALVKAGIPYELNGGTTFYEREEVRDVVAHLDLAANPADAVAFERICNRPVRGIGPQTLDAIVRRWAATGGALHDTCAAMTELDGIRITGKLREGLDGLARGLRALALGYEDGLATMSLLTMVLDDRGLGYQAYVASSKDRSRRRRLDNLAALRRIAVEVTDVDEYRDRVFVEHERTPDEADHVRLSTMHSSKGLEWDHVICVGFDAAVIPSPLAVTEGAGGRGGDRWDGPRGGGVEEERRLAHVAFTRPRLTLDVMLPATRSGRPSPPSPFLVECGLDPYEDVDPFAQKERRGRLAGSGGSRKGYGRG